MDKAVEEGNFERAVDLSSQLAGREVSHTTCMHSTDCRNSVGDGGLLQTYVHNLNLNSVRGWKFTSATYS